MRPTQRCGPRTENVGGSSTECRTPIKARAVWPTQRCGPRTETLQQCYIAAPTCHPAHRRGVAYESCVPINILITSVAAPTRHPAHRRGATHDTASTQSSASNQKIRGSSAKVRCGLRILGLAPATPGFILRAIVSPLARRKGPTPPHAGPLLIALVTVY